MFKLPPQPLLAPAGYRIPIRGQAPGGPLASRLGTPAGVRGRGRGKGKGKGKRSKGANKTATAPVTPKVENQPVTKNTTNTNEVKSEPIEIMDDDITDENWQVISEETEETNSPKTENVIDFQSDMFDTNSAECFSTFSEPTLVISDEAPATTTEEVVTEGGPADEDTAAKDDVIIEDIIEIIVADKDTLGTDDSQDILDKTFSDVESIKEQPTTKETKEKPSPVITTITAPEPSHSFPKDVVKTTSHGSLHCEVTICHVIIIYLGVGSLFKSSPLPP